jgi:hypothetical protein
MASSRLGILLRACLERRHWPLGCERMQLSRKRLTVTHVCCVWAVATALACRDFPADFSSLPLDDKITTYEHYLARTGRPRLEARSWISWHGLPAAEAMATYVSGQKRGIPRREAIEVLWEIQLRGCSLNGTTAQRSLGDFLSADPSPRAQDVELAREVLADIRANRHVDNLDTLPAGPCSRAPTGLKDATKHP